MNSTTCPYPGLRPFNEEESIFFKGREQQVERLVKRLEEKKFLMVNGASGDGKSSLIYAGVIPYAKAGFFKAKYNNWIVADFRPERSPLKNLTSSICKHLKIDNQVKTEKELGYGFSALCDLYKASTFYIDETKSDWINSDEKEKKILKRKGANLLVLVDQFEEFFTNPENYQNGIPSIESQKTVNLLLETYKLAAEQDLPIYVVCTMRSDYIGQCAAFRGLPEAIGYSQFFVPRLKRQEIEQVILGPAKLAGCSVSIRLTQTLVNSLNEGFDQLPILQHVLNQIWKIADNGNQEMDLIHLAMVGGLLPKLLLPEEKAKYEKWFEKIPEYKKELLLNPSLSNVLNMHANELMIFAADHYQAITNKTTSTNSVNAIIETAFKALTRIDAGRAIRRRTTPLEIINLHRAEKIDVEKLDAVLNIFRLQGNTFLQPFITETGSISAISEHTILDITHESLIRNWKLLRNWAIEENENYNTWKEVEKQLNRWIDSKFSSQYLLAVGPLSIYKEWFESFKPNKYWLLKYDESKEEITTKENSAFETIRVLETFLKKSDAALKRKRRLLIGFTSLAFIVLGSVAYWAFTQYIRSESFLQLAHIQTVNAINEKAKADKQTKMAILAKNEAENSKLKAVESAATALSAKDAADKAKQEALLLKNIAEQEKNKAIEQSNIAKSETEKAEKQKLIANEAKDNALVAEEKARKLSMLALAQNIAYKSAFIDNDNQLKAILAMEAYKIGFDFQGAKQDPAIYEALRASYAQLEFSSFQGSENNKIKDGKSLRVANKWQPNLKGTTLGIFKYEPSALSFSNTGYLIVTGKRNFWTDWDFQKDSLVNFHILDKIKDVKNVWLSPDANILLCQAADFSISFWSPGASPNNIENHLPLNLKEKYIGISTTQIIFKMQKKNINKASFSPNSQHLVLALKDSSIIILKVSNSSVNQTNEFKLNDHIHSIAISNDGNSIYYGNLKGTVNSINIKENKTINEILKTQKNNDFITKAICLSLSNDCKILAVGFNNGDLGYIKFSYGEFFQMNEKHAAQVENIIFDESAHMMVTSSADNSIKVFDLDNPEIKPITLKNHAEKIRSMVLHDSHLLIAGGLSGVLWKWELNSENLKQSIEPIINRELTLKEWKYYFGNDYEYDKRFIKK